MKRLRNIVPVLAVVMMCILSACDDDNLIVLNNKSGETIRYMYGTFYTPTDYITAKEVLDGDSLVLNKDENVSLESVGNMLDAGGFFQIVVIKQSVIDQNGADVVKEKDLIGKRYMLTKNMLEDIDYIVEYTGDE